MPAGPSLPPGRSKTGLTRFGTFPEGKIKGVTKEEALIYAQSHFPREHIKGFTRETGSSFRVRVWPKTIFDHTSFVSKVINDHVTLVFGTLK